MGNQCQSTLCCMNENNRELITNAKKNAEFDSKISQSIRSEKNHLSNSNNISNLQNRDNIISNDNLKNEHGKNYQTIHFENKSIYQGTNQIPKKNQK